ncbi:protein of unknown function DUF4782 containing protein [Nitzschia inconspicua]|uniref:VASt domain-containing protein n=1 Tax=Nitzschia inconspicua TaxID=303405 RepID=A0A9K3PQ02_9STRA|nr:protein of unknown function DUF4782 containing protein [Nitzschia inconspicua]
MADDMTSAAPTVSSETILTDTAEIKYSTGLQEDSNGVCSTEAMETDKGTNSPKGNDHGVNGSTVTTTISDDKVELLTVNQETNKEDNIVESNKPSSIDTESLASNSENVIDFSKSIRWSEALKSPKVPKFSPSLNPSRPGSLHGLGLKLAMQRSNSTELFCREIANFLNGIATLYEQYGVNLVKIAQSVCPGRLPFDEKSLVLQEDFAMLYENIKAFGDAFRSLAQYFRSSITASIRTTLAETSKTVEAANDRYQRVRQDCFQSRQSANALHTKYQNALQAAEDEIQLWLKKRNAGTPQVECDDNGIEMPDVDYPWEKVLHRFGKSNREGTLSLIQRLKDVKSCEADYVDAVTKENQKVDLSQEMESVALQKLQETEQDRLLLFALSVVDKVFHAEIDMERLKSATPLNANTEASFAEGFEKKSKDILAGLNAGLFKQQSLPYEPGMGVMEAETMGLPTEVGELRDKVKAAFSNHEIRIKATQTLLKLLEDIGELTSQSSAEVTIRSQAQIGNQPDSATYVHAMGARTGRLWLATVNTFQYEAKLFADVAFTCKKLKTQKLDKWTANATKNLKNDVELDDSAWKLVCDSARNEMKLESRYQYSKELADKARSRASSRGDMSGGPNDSSDPPTTPKADASASISSSHAPFRLFKGGGVMKKALGQISEDEKEEKDKLAFEEAVAGKEKAAMAYKAYAASRIEKLESQDKDGWEELKEIISCILKTATSLKEARKEMLSFKISQETKSAFPMLHSDLDDWSETVKERLMQKEKSLSSDTSSSEYILEIPKPGTGNVHTLLSINESEDSLPDLEKGAEEVDASQDRFIKQVGSFESAVSVKSESSSVGVSTVGDALKSSDTECKTQIGVDQSKMDSHGDLTTITQAFMKHFWSEKAEGCTPPTILEMFTCSYKPKEKTAFLTPNLPGRCFTTHDNFCFLSWDNKKFVLKWGDILSVEFDKGFMGASSDNAVAVTYRTEGSESVFTLSRLEHGEKTLTHLQGLVNTSKKEERTISSEADLSGGRLPPVPPDELLKEMEVVVSKTIKDVSIKSVYENVWEDPVGKKSFYESWLEEEECFDITMDDWDVAKPNSHFINPWCGEKGETYTQKRSVTFKFKRTTHLYIGPPVAIVKQQHYIRVEENDKIVLAIEATFEGIPYSDTFGVEMRWVATRQGNNDVKIEVGLFVLFKKNTMLKNQIKSGTISETKNVHLRLFNAVKKACAEPGAATTAEPEDEEELQDVKIETDIRDGGLLAVIREGCCASPLGAAGLIAAFVVGSYAFKYVFGSSGQAEIARLEIQMGELQEEVRALKKSVDLILQLLQENRH